MTTVAASTIEARRKRGRPRDPGVEDAALGAARDLLVEKGFSGCTIAAVAQQAGVGKGTIYLRWPDKEALVVDAMAEVLVDVECPDTGNLRDDLLELVGGVVRAFGGDRGPLLAAAVAELPRYPKLRALYEQRVIRPVLDMAELVITRAAKRREIGKVKDLGVVVDMIFSPIVTRAMVWHGQELDPNLARAIVDHILDGLRPR